MAPTARLRSKPTQLALFPGKKKATPTVLEFPKQCVIADACRRWIMPGWKWSHLPFGEYRTPATAGRLKRMGVMPGWPDLLFVHRTGLHHYVELKRVGEKLKPHQLEFEAFCKEAGIPYLCSTDVGEVLTTLQRWGALNPKVRF